MKDRIIRDDPKVEPKILKNAKIEIEREFRDKHISWSSLIMH